MTGPFFLLLWNKAPHILKCTGLRSQPCRGDTNAYRAGTVTFMAIECRTSAAALWSPDLQQTLVMVWNVVGIRKSKRSPRPRLESDDPALCSVLEDDPWGVKRGSGGHI